MSFHSVERFGFDRIFTDAPPPIAPGARPRSDHSLEVAALRAELDALKAEAAGREALARSEGYETGLAQARAEREAAMLSAVDALQAGLEGLDERFGEIATKVSADGAQIALAAADLLAARALEHAPDAAIDAAIGRAIAQVARGTELVVHVHPDIAEAIEAAVARRQAQDRRKLNVQVRPDESMPFGDARIGWDAGGLSLDAAARRARILAELETLLPHGDAPAD